MRTTITTVGMVSLLFIAGCAPLTEQQKEEREYRRVDWQNQYVAYNNRCLEVGGRMVVQASSMRFNGIPQRGDYYACTKRISDLPRD